MGPTLRLARLVHALVFLALMLGTGLLFLNTLARHHRAVLDANRVLEGAIAERGRAEETAATANRAKSDFLSRMSHELRTPLNGIIGFAQLLELDRLSAEQRESVEHVLKGGRHLLTLINEVLDLARIEAGKLSLSLEPVLAADVVGGALDLVRPQAAACNVTPPEGIACERYVMADRQRLQQVLLNLFSNAVKYNREGGGVAVSCTAAANGRVRIAVTDTGRGIAPAMLERLYTPFDRLGADPARVEGTGLGLALSKHLMDAMGGALLVESHASGAASTGRCRAPALSRLVAAAAREHRQDPVALEVGETALRRSRHGIASRRIMP